jgi:hypothetical protein
MSDQASTTWFHGNRYSAHAACGHCGGVVRHEAWCIRLNSAVFYAYRIVADRTVLTVGDAIILHSLGVVWTEEE